MRRNTLKAAALAVLAGTMLQFGGCLNVNQWLRAAAIQVAFEYVLDNDAVFDLFEGGTVAQ